MVAALVRHRGPVDRSRGWQRAIFSKKNADFSAFCERGKVSFTLRWAMLAQLFDISAETVSLLPKNNPTLTMFPQKGFIWSG
ncbi:hypothetical protein [Bradyrhizobium sp. Ghvi]|uniref:hypothetical protein n=1 Tax=Bradyrhizobium sp. Ghvi TaxID=1855319 RepID=UPI0011787EA9|nr:hypothetical protein [Bradyrhizobium sp. Ghvi]